MFTQTHLFGQKKSYCGDAMLSGLRNKVDTALEPVAKAFARAGFTPNVLTCIGLVVSLFAGILFAYGLPRFAAIALLVCGFFDMIDGAVARVTGKVTAFGGVLDSVVDRFTEAAIIIGIVYGGVPELGQWGWLAGVLALVGGFMVSYTRARAEAAGTGKLDVGFAERAERMLIFAIFALVERNGYAMILVAILSYVTVAHRLAVAYRRLAKISSQASHKAL
jgi:archaetidylinositol phosphate synthase